MSSAPSLAQPWSRPLAKAATRSLACASAADLRYGSCCEYMVQDWSFLHYALPSAHLGRSPSALVARVDRYDTGSDLSKLTAPDSVVSVDGGVDPGALRPSHRTARPDVVIKVARRMVLRELQLDDDRAICMAVVKHIEGNVLPVRCVPYRRYARRTWCTTRRRRDGKRAWCQVRPARRRVHGWAWPTRQ